MSFASSISLTARLAHLCASDDRQLVLLHNLSPERRIVPVQIEGCDADYRLEDLMQDAVIRTSLA